MTDIVSKNIDFPPCSLHCLAAGEEKDRDILLGAIAGAKGSLKNNFVF